MTNTNIIMVALINEGWTKVFCSNSSSFSLSHPAVNIVVFISIQLSGVLDRGKA